MYHEGDYLYNRGYAKFGTACFPQECYDCIFFVIAYCMLFNKGCTCIVTVTVMIRGIISNFQSVWE